MRQTSKTRRTIGIRGQLMGFLCFICLLLVGLFWFLSTQLLEPLYTTHIQKQLTEQAEAIVARMDEAIGKGETLSYWAFGSRLYVNNTFFNALRDDIFELGGMSSFCIDISDTTLRQIFKVDNLSYCNLHRTRPTDTADEQTAYTTARAMRQLCRESGGTVVRKINPPTPSGSVQLMVGRMTSDGNYTVLVTTSLMHVAEAGKVLSTVLPLAVGSRLALYGAGALQMVKGGTGSGDVNARPAVEIYDGLQRAGFTVTNRAWLRCAADVYSEARAAWRDCIRHKLKTGEEPHFFAAYIRTPFRSPALPPPEKTDCDAALYVVSRTSGEGFDRTPDAGDFCLSDAERRDLRILCGFGKPVILVLNIGGVMDLSPLDGLDGVRAVVLLSQPGMEGGSALADVLCGRVNPSGKLTDSWAYRYADYPCAKTGGDEPLTLTYREGIYVGYRYFDTFSVPVRYGFGAGLSYTEFFIRPLPLVQDGDALRLPVQVTNTGLRHAGRETVQVYATCPRGGQDREYRRLVAFAKTDCLQPGAAQRLELRIPLESLCAYDPDTGCWQWNAGDYYLWVGASLAQSKPTTVLHVERTAVQKTTARLWPDIRPETLYPDAKADSARRAALANYARRNNLPCLEPALPAPQADPAPRPDAAYHQAQKLADTLPEETLVQLCIGQWQPQQQDGPLTGVADTYLPGAAGVTSAVLQKDGVPPLILADGPAGLRVSREYFMRDGRLIPLPLERCFESGYLAQDCPEPDGEKFYQFCTAFPIGTMLAQSWDTALLQAVGHAVGREMEVYRVALWLAPGMNLHRDPLCGRNFEYFSEDPLLSGRMAAAMTAGVQSVPGRGTTVKHFACNNLENDRVELNSIVSERALRELYLKGFEIALRSPTPPAAVMTAYNLVNGVHAANSYALCTVLAREEWGYRGVLMTDWDSTGSRRCTAVGCMLAGNELLMPGCRRDYDELLDAVRAGKLPRAALQQCAARVIAAARQLQR